MNSFVEILCSLLLYHLASSIDAAHVKLAKGSNSQRKVHFNASCTQARVFGLLSEAIKSANVKLFTKVHQKCYASIDRKSSPWKKLLLRAVSLEDSVFSQIVPFFVDGGKCDDDNILQYLADSFFTWTPTKPGLSVEKMNAFKWSCNPSIGSLVRFKKSVLGKANNNVIRFIEEWVGGMVIRPPIYHVEATLPVMATFISLFKREEGLKQFIFPFGEKSQWKVWNQELIACYNSTKVMFISNNRNIFELLDPYFEDDERLDFAIKNVEDTLSITVSYGRYHFKNGVLSIETRGNIGYMLLKYEENYFTIICDSLWDDNVSCNRQAISNLSGAYVILMGDKSITSRGSKDHFLSLLDDYQLGNIHLVISQWYDYTFGGPNYYKPDCIMGVSVLHAESSD